MSSESETFANRQLLVAALKGMGLQKIDDRTDLLFDGLDKREQHADDMVIRKRDVPSQQLLSDTDFQKTGKRCVAVLDDRDLD